MRKICLLITMLLLVGCGGGTNSSNVSSSAPGGIVDVGPETPMASITVNIKSGAANAANEKTAEAAPSADHMRLVVTNPGLRVNGSAYKVIVDGLTKSSLAMAFPVAGGYNFQLVTYTPQGVLPSGPTVNRMLQYAESLNQSISSGTTTVDLALSNITASFTISDPTLSGDTVVPVLTMGTPTPLESSNWNLFLSTSDITHARHSTGGPGHTGLKAPIVFAPGQLYAQGEFYINAALVDTTGKLESFFDTGSPTGPTVVHSVENFRTWTFNYPNPDFGDASYFVTLNLVGVTINITP